MKSNWLQTIFSLYSDWKIGGANMGNELVYLDTYILQQDMRIRLPKTILQNMNVEKGETHFDIYLNREDQSLILRPTKKRSMNDTAI